MARKSKPNRQSDNWLDMVEEVPRAGLPDAAKMRKRARTYRVYVWSAAVLFPFALLSNLVMASNSSAEPTPVVKADGFSQTKPVAMVTVENWLKGDPSPLPSGRLLSWDRAEKVASPPLAAGDDKNLARKFETHFLTLTTPAGTLFTATVQLATSNANGTEVVSMPSLIPRAPDNQSGFDGSSPWPKLEANGQKPEQVDQSVLKWAKDFTSGDPDTLRLSVGDTKKNRSYIPLSGLTVVNTDIRFSAFLYSSDEIKNGAESSAKMVAQVEVEVRWDVQGAPTTGKGNAILTYDVLVDRANTASPIVVAWGAPGTGPTLKAFSNAVSGRKITAAPTDEPTSEPTETAPITDPIVDPGTEPTVEPTATPTRAEKRAAYLKKKRAAARAAAERGN